MGGSSCKQAPPWVARVTIANATSPLPILSQLRLENVIASIEKYRAQAQTARALDVGSLEDLCDDFVSDCRHFAKNDFRKQLIALYTTTPSQTALSCLPAFQTSLTGVGGAAATSTAVAGSSSGAVDVTQSAHGAVSWKEDVPSVDAGEDRGAWVQVDCQQVFASLILIASGPLEAKVEYLVKLFCWTEQQEIEAPAVYLLLVAVVRGVSLLTQNVPPSDLLLAETLERVDACAECTENCSSFVFEHVKNDKVVVSTWRRDQERSFASDSNGKLSDDVHETLKKCASKVWRLPSVVAALTGDAAVKEYHDTVTKIFLRSQIEEKLSETVRNFRRTLQRVTNPAGFQGTETAEAETWNSVRRRSSSAGRTAALKKKSQTVEAVEFDLVPLPWKHIDAILRSCLPKQIITTRLLDELQFETRAACQDLGIEWKKWLDEPIQDTLNNANLAELLPQGQTEVELSTSGRPESPLRGSYQRARAVSPSTASPPQAAQASSYLSQLSSATSRTLFRFRGAQGASPTPHIFSQGKSSILVESAAPATTRSSKDAGTEGVRETNEPVSAPEHSGIKPDHWKFAFSSGTYMWSDDVQLIVTPLLAFCAIDCHGDGVISARHLDLLFYLLKIVDPVRGGFFSKVEKIITADTRALFSLSVDALDPFSQLKKIMCKQRQEIRLLSFAVAISICATIQDRRQHENSLRSKFKRFDLDQSNTISRSDLEVLVAELIKNAVNIEDSGAGHDQALQAVVDKTINTLVESTADRVEFNIYKQAHDCVRKNARKLKAEILELASQFEVGYSLSRRSSRLKRINSQKTRSSSILRMGSHSGLGKSSQTRSSSKNAISDNSLKSFLGRH